MSLKFRMRASVAASGFTSRTPPTLRDGLRKLQINSNSVFFFALLFFSFLRASQVPQTAANICPLLLCSLSEVRTSLLKPQTKDSAEQKQPKHPSQQTATFFLIFIHTASPTTPPLHNSITSSSPKVCQQIKLPSSSFPHPFYDDTTAGTSRNPICTHGYADIALRLRASF